MASESQVQANRMNAQKSTGPRSAEGKAAVAGNAVKHGLAATVDVVSWEDPSEFQRHRETLLAELAPAGMMETVLAERVVSLTWRLQRAQRMQTEVLNHLTAEPTGKPPLASLLKALAQKNKQPSRDAGRRQTEHTIGRALCDDWAHEAVLDRMLMYERRIESSLFRTSAELQRLQLMRKLEEGAGQGNPAEQSQSPVEDESQTPPLREEQVEFSASDEGRIEETEQGQAGSCTEQCAYGTREAIAGEAGVDCEPTAAGQADPCCETKPISEVPLADCAGRPDRVTGAQSRK